MSGSRPRIRRRRSALVIAAGLAVASLLGAAPASAHSELERSEPPNGGMVGVGRSTLTLWFSEPISVAASTFGLHTLGGAPLAFTVAPSGAAGRRFVEIRTKPLARETYLLDWRAVSLDDGHQSSGSMVFGVGTRPAVVPAGEDGLPPAPDFLLRWLDLSAIMLAIGALAVSGRVLGSMGSSGDSPLRRARTIAALAAGIAVLSGAITPLLRTPRGGGSLGFWLDTTWASLTGTPWGHLWIAREAALVVAVVALCSWAALRNGSGSAKYVAGVALAAAVGLEGWAGHAADLPRQSDAAALASAFHLAAAGVWAGGLTILTLCVIPVMRRNPDSRGALLASVWRTFSPIAALATVVLLATGLYASGRQLPDVHSVGSTVYGNVVAGKVGLLAVALILAGFNTLLVNPWLAATVGRILSRPPGWTPVAPGRFAALAVIEVAVVVAAVAVAAVLTSVPTAREVGAVTAETSPIVANVDGLFVTFEEVPAGAEQTRLIVRTHSTVKPEPAPVSRIKVRLAGPAGTTSELSLRKIEPGRYEAETSALVSGAWQASVAVQRDGLPDAVTTADWTVDAASAEDVHPLESITTTLTVLLLAAAVGAVAMARVRRERPPGWIPRVDKEPGRQP